MAKDKSENKIETQVQVENTDIIVDQVEDTIVNPAPVEVIDTPINEPELIDQTTINTDASDMLNEPEIIDQPTITPEPEAELIESSTPELNAAKESTLSDEAPVRAKIISMTVRPTGSFVM